MNIDPVGRWRSHEGRRQEWRNVVSDDGFLQAVNAALLEAQMEWCGQPDGGKWLQGANKIVQRLLTLHELPITQKQAPGTLKYPKAGA